MKIIDYNACIGLGTVNRIHLHDFWKLCACPTAFQRLRIALLRSPGNLEHFVCFFDNFRNGSRPLAVPSVSNPATRQKKIAYTRLRISENRIMSLSPNCPVAPREDGLAPGLERPDATHIIPKSHWSQCSQ